MTADIPDEFKDLLTNPYVATVATLMPDNQPQLTAVWVKLEGNDILFSTTKGRQKADNLMNRPQATIHIIDPEDPYRYIEVRGTVSISEENALDLIDELAREYTGAEQYYGGVAPAENKDQEERIICTLTPSHVVTFG